MHAHFTFQVARAQELDEMIERFNGKLERLLWVFQPDLVRLHGRLIHGREREGTVCTLDLHLPTAQLYAEATAAAAQQAFSQASEDLMTQARKHRRKLTENRRREQRAAAANGTATPAAVEAEDAVSGAEARAALAATLPQRLPGLQAFVERRLQWHENAGDIPEGVLEPREVLDEVVVEALSTNPEGTEDSERWFVLLAERAMRRLLKSYQTPGAATSPEEAEAEAEGGEAGSGDTATPEQIATTAEMIEQLTAAARVLPPEQRRDVMLWLLEGFTVRELAMVSRRPRRQVAESLAAARRRLGTMAELPRELRQQLA